MIEAPGEDALGDGIWVLQDDFVVFRGSDGGDYALADAGDDRLFLGAPDIAVEVAAHGDASPDLHLDSVLGHAVDGVAAAAAPYPFTPVAAFDIRYGRFSLENVYGPENIGSLPMPFRLEHWDGSRFMTHMDDSCTTWNTADLTNSANHNSLSAGAPPSDTFSMGEAPPLELVPNGTRGTDSLVWNVDAWLEFDWNDVGLENDPNRMKHIHNVGVIAQEIYAVMPEVVHERVDGFLAVDYERMCALLIQAIKEQQEQINDLKSDVIKLCEESHVHGPKGSAAVDPKTEKILYEEE